MATVGEVNPELASLLSREPEQASKALAAHCATFVPTEASVQMLADACRER
jgi:hypothetical protein